MTLKKSKRNLAKGQSALEYFVLTAAVVAVVLFFSNSNFFKNIKNSFTNDNNTGAFDQAVEKILVPEGK